MKEDASLTVSISEAARLLGISRGSAYSYANSGELPTVRIGRRLLVPRSRLIELVDAGRRGRN